MRYMVSQMRRWQGADFSATSATGNGASEMIVNLNEARDVDFLLSLVDSQAVSTDVSVLTGYEAGFNDAATRMRDKCVEKVRTMRDEYEAAGQMSTGDAYHSYSAMKAAAKAIIAALES